MIINSVIVKTNEDTVATIDDANTNNLQTIDEVSSRKYLTDGKPPPNFG